MSDLDEFGIPEEEWSLLTNALAEPVEQLIVVESKDPRQLREIERRLPELIGRRRLLRQAVDFNAMREPENVWKTAQSLTQPVNINVVELSRQEISPTPLFQRGGFLPVSRTWEGKCNCGFGTQCC